MKQQPEAIQRVRQSTHGTIKNIKNCLTQECLKLEGAVFDIMFSQCMDSLETLILSLISDLGSEYLRITKNLGQIEASVLGLKGENKQLHQELTKVNHLIEEKNQRIQSLQADNSTLLQKIVALQNYINQFQQSESSLDSIENQEGEDLESYVSETSSSD